MQLRKINIYNLALAVPLLLAISLAIACFVIPNMIIEDARDAAGQSAVQTVRQFKIIRGYYTKNVVSKAKATGALTPSIEHVGIPGAIPLPATLIHDLSTLLAEENTTMSLYSAYPFPNRKDRVMDGFMNEAWAYLSVNPTKVFKRNEMYNGKSILRVAVADVFTAKGCVSCHNGHLDSPKTDWKLGDVRGIMEVGTNINQAVRAASEIKNFLLLGAFLALLVSFIMVKFGNRAKQHMKEIEEAHLETETARQEAYEISLQDPLTGLPNRRAFSEHIKELDNDASNKSKSFSVLLIDLDRFKPINDIYGHEVGDFVICTAAERLEKAVGKRGIVARLGGDEFGVVFDKTDPDSKNLAEEIIASIEAPIVTGNVRAEISASIGIATSPNHGSDTQSLLRAADLAMYNVKKNGRAGWDIFNEDLDIEMRATAKLESDVRSAVGDHKFQPFFQPIVDIQSGKIHGFEILARWDHPELGNILPENYLPIIEQFDLMNEFTSVILQQACSAAKDWPKDTKLALNISPAEICDPATPVRLMSILTDLDFSPTRLEIEIAETALIQDFDIAKQVISSLREAGIRVVLDDFGTGYSSLGYLRELNIDGIKIDRSFVLAMDRNKDCEKIVLSMISLAQNLGLQTIVEGIENKQILERIRGEGATFGQGYLFSKAIPAVEVGEMFDTKSASFVKVG
ncbi:MAG: EAL domain-containing protein [Rhizobiaceae bacterium]|nr:EAL domain-containing protein [Rhizobiaceae bacterium]